MEFSLNNFLLLVWLVLGIFYFIFIFHKDIATGVIFYSIRDVLPIDKKKFQIESNGLFAYKVNTQNGDFECNFSKITLFPNITLALANQNGQKEVCEISVLTREKTEKSIRKALMQIGVL